MKLEINEYGKIDVVLPVRIAFSQNGLNYFKSSIPPQGNNPSWSFCGILQPEHTKLMKKACKMLVDKHLNGVMPSEEKHRFIKNGDNNKSKKDGEVYDGFEGLWYIKFVRKDINDMPAPKVMKRAIVDGVKKMVQCEDHKDPSIQQDGAYANVQFTIYVPKIKDGGYREMVCASPEAIVYTGREFEAFTGGSGGAPLDEESLWDGVEENEVADGEGFNDSDVDGDVDLDDDNW